MNNLQNYFFRSSSNNEEDIIRNRINRAIKAIDNAIGSKATGHFLAMPTVLSKWVNLIQDGQAKSLPPGHIFKKYSYSLNSAEYQWIG